MDPEDIDDCCMCGDSLNHSSWVGHNPVSMKWYCSERNDEPNDQPQRRKPQMNYSSAVFLINKNVRAIKVTYDKAEGGKSPSEYTFKTLDTSIKVDDFVVVPTDTRHGLTVVKVTQCDVDIDLDDAATQYKWIVARVDRTGYDQTLLDEAQAVKVIRLAEFNKKRSDLREGMLGASMDEIKALPIAALNGPTKATT